MQSAPQGRSLALQERFHGRAAVDGANIQLQGAPGKARVVDQRLRASTLCVVGGVHAHARAHAAVLVQACVQF